MQLRSFIVAAALALATFVSGCSTDGTGLTFSSGYGARRDMGYQVPAIPISRVPQKFHRQTVRNDTKEKAGTIIVDTGPKFLY